MRRDFWGLRFFADWFASYAGWCLLFLVVDNLEPCWVLLSFISFTQHPRLGGHPSLHDRILKRIHGGRSWRCFGLHLLSFWFLKIVHKQLQLLLGYLLGQRLRYLVILGSWRLVEGFKGGFFVNWDWCTLLRGVNWFIDYFKNSQFFWWPITFFSAFSLQAFGYFCISVDCREHIACVIFSRTLRDGFIHLRAEYQDWYLGLWLLPNNSLCLRLLLNRFCRKRFVGDRRSHLR